MEELQVNGASLAYVEMGQGSPVLLVHGTGAYTDVWGDIPQRLADAHRVVAYDRRGFGASSGTSAHNLEDQVEDAAALLDQLDATPATVVGWSGGGVIAMMLAVQHPGKVASLVLSEPALHVSTHPSASLFSMIARHRIARLRRQPGAAAAAMYRWHTPPGTPATTFDDYPAEWRRQMTEHGAATVREMDQELAPAPRRRDIASISCPVTVMVGNLSDTVFPRCARFLLKVRPQTRWVDLEGAGHTPHLDRPDLWVQTVAECAAALPQPAAA